MTFLLYDFDLHMLLRSIVLFICLYNEVAQLVLPECAERIHIHAELGKIHAGAASGPRDGESDLFQDREALAGLTGRAEDQTGAARLLPGSRRLLPGAPAGCPFQILAATRLPEELVPFHDHLAA